MAKTGEKHHGARRLADKVEDAVAGWVGKVRAAVPGSRSDLEFIRSAAIGDMYAIAAAKVALKHAQSPTTKSVAEAMITDHTDSAHRLRSALASTETEFEPEDLPHSVDDRRRMMLDHLQTAPDEEFDAGYLAQQVLAHEETVTLMAGYRDKGNNPRLRSYAADMAPVVARYLDRLRALEEGRAA